MSDPEKVYQEKSYLEEEKKNILMQGDDILGELANG